MVLVQKEAREKKHRGEERGSEKQGRWGTGGEQERRERARPSSTQLSTRRRPPSIPAPLARCAVRALGRVRARAPPLPPCLRGGAWAGESPPPLRCRRVGGYVAGRGAGAAARG